MKYDVKYYHNMLYLYTHSAEEITKIRWDFLLDNFPFESHLHLLDDGFTVLDYGCGVGWFAAFKPYWAKIVDTYDIMPTPQSGITREKYTLLTLWDVLEHIPDFTELGPVLKKVDFVAFSIPIKPSNTPWETWKHFKPGEHLHYYTSELLVALFNKYDFTLLIEADTENDIRYDIKSFIFKKGKQDK